MTNAQWRKANWSLLSDQQKVMFFAFPEVFLQIFLTILRVQEECSIQVCECASQRCCRTGAKGPARRQQLDEKVAIADSISRHRQSTS